MATIAEYNELVKRMEHYSDLYYNQDNPAISDADYDELTKKLKEMEQEHPEWVIPESPTQHVGGAAVMPGAKKVQHRVQLASLNDIFNMDDVAEWYKGIGSPRAVVETKIDGLSMELIYKDGIFVQGSTRGDGFIGEDVTENAKVVHGVPLTLDLSGIEGLAEHNTLSIRGEVYQPVEEFVRVNEELEEAGKKLFANPRNCAAGSLRTKDPQVTADRNLGILCFSILYQEGWDGVAESVRPGISESQDLALLKKLGFNCVDAYMAHSMCEIESLIERIGEYRSSLPYWTDGAVIKTDDKALQARLGSTVKFPKHATAFKYPPERKETTIRDIIVQTGRTGALTPVAVFDPIYLCGTKVSRATLHNQGFINEMKLGIGAKCIVLKSGEIIPKVVETVTPAAEPFVIKKCPMCGGDAVMDIDANGEETGVMRCVNVTCPAQKARYIEFYASKEVMNIDGMGPAMVENLIDLGVLNSIEDIYTLHEHRAEISSMPNMGKKSCDSLLNAIEKSKSSELFRIIKGLGIPGVGAIIGKELEKKFKDIWEIAALSYDDLIAIDGIGNITAKAISDYFSHPENISRLKTLEATGVNMRSTTFGKETEGNLVGLTFVITGTLPSMGRDEAKALIEANGGKCSGSVSKKTNYLLAGENAGSKLTKAQELGIKIISEDELKSMLQQH